MVSINNLFNKIWDSAKSGSDSASKSGKSTDGVGAAGVASGAAAAGSAAGAAGSKIAQGAATLQKKDNHTQSLEKAGSAASAHGAVDTEKEIKSWIEARGPKDTKVEFKFGAKTDANPRPALDALMKKLSPDDAKNFKKFVNDSVDAYMARNPGMSKKDAFSFINNQLNDGLAKTGITEKQVKMATSGQFSPEAYVSLVVDKGQPIG